MSVSHTRRRSRMSTRGWQTIVALALCAAAAFAAVVLPSRAAAAPIEPTLTLVELQTLLDAGPVTGYFKTVDQGDHIATVPMTVLSIAGGAGPDGALILFEADMTDPLMQRIGTIAAGMSGSPLFVDDGGTDKLIGALSYGDWFTLGGLALATPIEYMSAVDARYSSRLAPRTTAPQKITLPEPVSATDGATVRNIVVAHSKQEAEKARAAGATVFAPLAQVQIGGLPKGSRAYAALSKALAKRHTVLNTAGTGAHGWDPNFTTELKGGAALAAMYTRGDLWAGGIGTVTYVNDTRLVAFGHPFDWIGPTSLYLCNAQIDGIWPSSLSAYKLGTPGMVRGSLTQDRGSAVAGTIGAAPAEVPVTSQATLDSSTATSETWVTQRWADDDWYGSEFIGAAASVAAYKVSDRVSLPGSAETTTKVVVTDGTTQYTIERTNLWDDPEDVLWLSAMEAVDIIDTINYDPHGVASAHIVSVDTDVTLSETRRSATIVDVSVPGGLRIGDNTVVVSFRPFGQTTPVTLETTLTLPAGTLLEGELCVAPANGSESPLQPGDSGPSASSTPLTLAEIVDKLNALPSNNEIAISFTPSWYEGEEEEAITAIASTDYVVHGSAVKSTPGLRVFARPAKVYRYGRTVISGRFFGADETADETVRIYRRTLGQPKFVLVATVPVMSIDGMGFFSYRTPRLRGPAVFRAEWDGNDMTLAAKASVLVGLRRR